MNGPFTIMKGFWAFFFNFSAMYMLISLCYFNAKGQIAGTQHHINGHIFGHDMTSAGGIILIRKNAKELKKQNGNGYNGRKEMENEQIASCNNH